MILGIVVTAFGLLFALQGFGVVGGSPMSNTTTWSVLGPIIALIGIAMAGAAARRAQVLGRRPTAGDPFIEQLIDERRRRLSAKAADRRAHGSQQ